jgi:hypothetical protein
MLKTQGLVALLSAALTVGLISVTHADGYYRGWDGYYNQHPNHNGDFTNSDAWSGKIVEFDREAFEVVRYGERIRLRLLDGHPTLYMGQRVRVVPFRRDGRYEIGELRLPDYDWMPVATVRYIESRVPKGQPYYPYDRAYGSRFDGYSRGSGWGVDVWIEKDRPKPHRGWDGRRQPQKWDNRRPRYDGPPRYDGRHDDDDGDRRGPRRSFKAGR